jgi:hypothetical protein
MLVHRCKHSLDGTRVSCPGLVTRARGGEAAECHTRVLLQQLALYMLAHRRNHSLDGTRVSCPGLEFHVTVGEG